MHHNDDSKIPNLEHLEYKYGSKFKRIIRECYDDNDEKIHDYAKELSDNEGNDPDFNDIQYPYGPGDMARIIGGEALSNIDSIKARINRELAHLNPTDEEISHYLGKCALRNGDEEDEGD